MSRASGQRITQFLQQQIIVLVHAFEVLQWGFELAKPCNSLISGRRLYAPQWGALQCIAKMLLFAEAVLIFFSAWKSFSVCIVAVCLHDFKSCNIWQEQMYPRNSLHKTENGYYSCTWPYNFSMGHRSTLKNVSWYIACMSIHCVIRATLGTALVRESCPKNVSRGKISGSTSNLVIFYTHFFADSNYFWYTCLLCVLSQ